jgi:hypothetical protein
MPGRLWSGCGSRLKLYTSCFAEERAPHIPAHTLLDADIAHTNPVQYFERALGITDATRTDRNRVVVIQHHHRHTLRQLDRRSQPHRAGTDHHHRVALLGGPALLRRAGVRVFWIFVGTQHALSPDIV